MNVLKYSEKEITGENLDILLPMKMVGIHNRIISEYFSKDEF